MLNPTRTNATETERLDRDIDAWTRDQTHATDPNALRAYSRLFGALLLAAEDMGPEVAKAVQTVRLALQAMATTTGDATDEEQMEERTAGLLLDALNDPRTLDFSFIRR